MEGSPHIPAPRFLGLASSEWPLCLCVSISVGCGRLYAKTRRPVFLRNPEFAYRIWYHYNHALVTFAQLHRDRTIIVNATAVMQDPQKLLDLIHSRFGIDLDREP